MHKMDPKQLTERENYKFLIGSIIPRPIAFVTSISQTGVVNAAPFSFFNIVSSNPPMISVSIQRKQGQMKDTARNIREKGQFVVHIVDTENVEKVNETAANLPPEQSEIERADLILVKSTKIEVPGVKEAKIRFECELDTALELGLMDAVEVVPTFNSDKFVGLLAGGSGAFVKAGEGAEDSKELGVKDLKDINFTNKDFLIGIAASGRTPYVIGAIEYAKSLGAKTGCVVCNKGSEIGKIVEFPIEVDAGSEVLTGSTRLKSGSCQKIILNMISTVTMVKVGKVYKNLMVDVKASNEKLEERCRRIVMMATGCDHDKADNVLKETNNSCKVAIVMILLGKSKDEALASLKEANGFIRNAK